MGRRTQAAILLLVFSFAIAASQQAARSGVTMGNPVIQQIVDGVSSDSLMKTVRSLQTYDRYEYNQTREAAAKWLEQAFNALGAEAESDEFTIPFCPFYDISWIDARTAVAVGSRSTILVSSDRGMSWSLLRSTPSGLTLFSVGFFDYLHGWAVGDSGIMLQTTNGGSTWSTHSSGFSEPLLDMTIGRGQTGIVVGGGGRILRMTAGDTGWTAVSSPTTESLSRVHTIDGINTWAVGSGGTIVHSTDGGNSWGEQSSGVASDLGGVFFLNGRLGWIVGSGSTFLKTTDGGSTWIPAELPPDSSSSPALRDVCFADSLNGWVVEYTGEVWRTTDGGIRWSGVNPLREYDPPQLARIIQSDGPNLMVCGETGEIASSTDAGETWSRQTPFLPEGIKHGSRNIRVTLPGMVTPAKEVLLVAYYDSPQNSPGADNNASGVSALVEAVRILRNYQFESTITILAVAGQVVGHSGIKSFVSQRKYENRSVLGAFNATMIGYPVTSDTTHLAVGSYLVRNRLVDSALIWNNRYAIGAAIAPFADSLGGSDHMILTLAGVDAAVVSEATTADLYAGGNPYNGLPLDLANMLHPDLLRRATRLLLASIAELARPVMLPAPAWTWESPFPQWNHLRASYAFDANTLVAVGDLGTIVKTTDAGQSWIRQVSESMMNLRGVSFGTSSIGIAVGDYGTILRTDNGGASWSGQTIDPTVTFYAICFADAKTATAVGYPSAIYRTTNGGITWYSQLSGPASTLRGVSFSDLNTGTIVGSSGTILRTTNGGLKWTRQLSGFEETDTLFSAVSFSGAAHGIAVGRSGTIIHTTDGGATWLPRASTTAYHLNSVSLIDEQIAFVAGETGIVLKTSDGGFTWGVISTGITDWYGGASFTNRTTGTLVGSFGTIVRTTDGGMSWTLQTSGPRTPLNSVWFTDGSNGTIVGYRGSIFRTTNAGATWITQASGVTPTLWSICFIDPTTAVAVGQDGTIIRTTNAGTTWTVQRTSLLEWLSGVSFATPQVGIVVGKRSLPPPGRGEFSLVLRTTDGGITWNQQTISTDDREFPSWLFAVSCGDQSTVIAAGDNGILLRSTDAGLHWTQLVVTGERLNAVSAIGKNIATVVGDHGTILRTADGGETWSFASSGTGERLNSVWFANAVYGVAAGDGGVVLRTTNRGATWTRQPSVTVNNLSAAHLSSAYLGTLVGDNGTILRTAAINIPVSVHEPGIASLPASFALNQNYPNPFNASTVITFHLLSSGYVNLRVFDLLGREIAVLVDEERRVGTYRVAWDASRYSSGVYLIRLQTREGVETRKMLLLK